MKLVIHDTDAKQLRPVEPTDTPEIATLRVTGLPNARLSTNGTGLLQAQPLLFDEFEGLLSYPATITYNSDGVVVSKSWATPLGTVTRTTTRVDGLVTEITFSGTGLPTNLTQTKKRLTYTNGLVSGVAYE